MTALMHDVFALRKVCLCLQDCAGGRLHQTLPLEAWLRDLGVPALELLTIFYEVAVLEKPTFGIATIFSDREPPALTLALEITSQCMFYAEFVVVEHPLRHLCKSSNVIVRFGRLAEEEECFEQTHPIITHTSAIRSFPLHVWKPHKSVARWHSPGADDTSWLDKDVEKME